MSTDLGRSWQRLGFGLAGSILSICPVAGEPDLLFCGTTTGLYKSTDAGFFWTRKGAMTNVRAIALDPAGPASVWCGTAAGVYASSDGGETWGAFNTGLGMTDVLGLVLRTGIEPVLFAGTNGGSVYRTALATAVAEPSTSARAAGFTLAPNPCRGRAQLSARLFEAAPVTISDIAGRRVWTGTLDPTEGSLALPRLTAGVYLVRLGTGNGGKSEKLVVQQ